MNRFSDSPSVNGHAKTSDPAVPYLDQLNALWKQAEEELTAMGLCMPIEVEVATDAGDFYNAGSGDEPGWIAKVFLGWRKWSKGWRLSIGTLTDYLDGEKPTWDWKPIAESTKERRIELAEHYPKLKEAMRQAQRAIIPQAAAAIASLKQSLGN